MKRLASLLAVLIIVSVSIIQAQDTIVFKSPLEINGVQQADSIICVMQNGNYSADVKQLMELVGGEYYPFAGKFFIYGFATQYGKILSFSRDDFATGFYKSNPIVMLPPARKIQYDGVLLQVAPTNFLSKALGDTVYYDKSLMTLIVTIDPPDTIGSVIPDAADLAKSLKQNGYHVRQAGIDHTNAITICNAGYAPDCQGNNAGFPYFVINMPPAPSYDTLYNSTILFNLRNDEAIIAIGKTPPECKYFSYRSYLVSRLYTIPDITRKKIYASLGDATSCYSMKPNLPIVEMFERDFAVISASDSIIAYQVKQLIMNNTTIPEGDIYFDVIPSDIYRFGFSQLADWGNFLHRASIFTNSSAGNAYINNPTLEILRVTPITPNTPVYLSNPALKSRITGNDEFYLNDEFEQLEHSLFNNYINDYDVAFLDPCVWLMEGYQAIQEMKNVLGEVRDALYIRTESFSFNEDDIIVVYGVNHTKTGKAVYSNVSCYRDSIFAGYGGIKNNQYEKTAREYIADTAIADYFFVYKFARYPIANDSNVYIVPQDTDNNLLGINFGGHAFMAFRAYIDTTSKVGPSPQEVIFSRALLLRPKGSGFGDIERNSTLELSLFPNPVHDEVVFVITTQKPAVITMSIYNMAGQFIDQPLVNTTIINTEEITWNVPKRMNRGVYIIRMYSVENGSNKMNLVSKKIVVN